MSVRSRLDFDYKKLIKSLEENRKRFESLIISGGEPTIYPYILKYIRHAKKICKYKKIFIATNGFMLYYDSFVDKLILAGVDTFQISFVTHHEKIFDGVTKVKGAFRYVTKGILNVKKRNKKVVINAVIHKLNYKSIDESVAFLINNGVDLVQLAFMNPIGSSIINGKSPLQVTYTELMPYIKGAFKKAEGMNFDNLYIENIPICIAKEFIPRISDLRKPKENKDYYNAGKTKPGKCKKCLYFDVCDGAWKAYVKQFGEEELKPLKKALIEKGD